MNLSSNVTTNHNLFAAISHSFPADKNGVAIEVIDPVSAQTLRTLTWREIDERTAQFANLLDALSLPAGARIAVQTAKSAEAQLLYLAVLRAGFVYLPLNTAYQTTEIEYFINDAQPSVFVCAPEQEGRLKPLALSCDVKHTFTLDEHGRGTLVTAATVHALTHQVAHCDSNDLAAILYTSGTTGRSKGAMLSHGNLFANGQTLVQAWAFTSRDVLIHTLPIFHVHGLFVATQCALMSGARMMWLSRFEPAAVLRLLPRATVFMGVPTMYVRLLAYADQDTRLNASSCANMRLFVAGSAPLLLDTFKQFQTCTGHTILERYGMSETNMLCANPYFASDGERRGGTVGPPLPGVQVRIAGSSGRSAAVDEIGGIEVRGPNVFSGYWRMPEKTHEDFTADHWFKTGDVGKIDTQGYVTIVGRSKDLIISGGYNVYPAEIEGFLNELPGVSESAVIGVPHPDFGEAVVAVITASQGALIDSGEIISALKQQIANFKVPKRVFVVAELPRNTMGKVQKNVLRQLHQQLFV